MSNETSQTKKVDEGFSSSLLEKGKEAAIDRVLNGVLDFVGHRYGEAQVLTRVVYRKYLNNAYNRLNQVKTLVTGNDPVPILGKGSIYVSIGVRCQGKVIDTSSVDNLLNIHSNILLTGTGGVGKSMLLRYFFLNTINRGTYIPVLIELRKLSKQEKTSISITELILECMNDYDVVLDKDQFIYSLEHGGYLFLMDGFDEIRDDISRDAASLIQAFCSKYPNNACIVTSRKDREFSSFETFVNAESMMLTKTQAVQLAHKIYPNDEKAKAFCRELENTLYDQHQDFAENPLLLTMMFITFMNNTSIPDHLVDFYNKAFNALYSAHDSRNKGAYVRSFKTEDIEEADFIRILSRFCFITFFKEEYEFKHAHIISRIRESIVKLGIPHVNGKDYLDDLIKAICLIIRDGDIFKFSHRSFQSYFAALYIRNLPDEQQNAIFDRFLFSSEFFWDNEDFYTLLFQLEPDRFQYNVLKRGIEELVSFLDSEDQPYIKLFNDFYSHIHCRLVDGKTQLGYIINPSSKYYYRYSLYTRFCVLNLTGEKTAVDNKKLRDRIVDILDTNNLSTKRTSISELHSVLSKEELSVFYDSAILISQFKEKHMEMKKWLNKLKQAEQQRVQEARNDDFLNSF